MKYIGVVLLCVLKLTNIFGFSSTEPKAQNELSIGMIWRPAIIHNFKDLL